MEYKLDISLSYDDSPVATDVCMLCGDAITGMRFILSSDRTVGNQLMLLFDEPCIAQIAAITFKSLMEQAPDYNRESN